MLICSIEKSSLNRSDILSSPVAFMSSLLFPPSDLSVWHHKHTLQDTLSRVSCSIMHTKINTNHSPSKDDLVTESESQPSVLARITIRPQSLAKELFSKHKKRNKPPFQEYCKKNPKKLPKLQMLTDFQISHMGKKIVLIVSKFYPLTEFFHLTSKIRK